MPIGAPWNVLAIIKLSDVLMNEETSEEMGDGNMKSDAWENFPCGFQKSPTVIGN